MLPDEGMAPELTIRRWIEAFTERLSTIEAQNRDVTRLANFGGGFENWLKLEMAKLLMVPPYVYEAWVGPDLNVAGDVGIEYWALLKEEGAKRIDLWASPLRSAKKWHFVELKVAFDNQNAGKQFASWRSDFESLRLIDGTIPRQRVAGIGSIMFAMGFDEKKFDSLVASSAEGAKTSSHPWTAAVPLRNGNALRIAALMARK